MEIPYETAREVFGLNEGFSDKEVKSSFRKLSKICHPDNGGNSNLFRFISECKKVLEAKDTIYNNKAQLEKAYTRIALEVLYEEYYWIDEILEKYENIKTVYTYIDIYISNKRNGEYKRQLIIVETPISVLLSSNYVSFFTNVVIPKEFSKNNSFYVKIIYMGKEHSFKLKRRNEIKELAYNGLMFKSYLKIQFC